MTVKNIVLQNTLHYCKYNPTFFYIMHMVHLWTQLVHSWHPNAMNGPAVKFNKIFFFEQLSMSYICEIWFHCIEQSKVFKAMFVLCPYATYRVFYYFCQ
jgi:hypothetical protein